jgi:hypothetical protein
MWRRFVAIWLVFGLSFAPCLAYSVPLPSLPSVPLSQAEYDAIITEIEQAQKALEASSNLIAKQSKDLKTLSLLCGGLAAVVVLSAIAR